MKIFISYRRADSRYVVDRIRDRLIAAYGEEAVFRDIESIPLGMNFADVLEEATSTCNVMLVVIGTQWTTITDAQGNKRLFDPGDYTRIEVETGLKHKEILVIPVLVMNATMPGPKDIPESLADLLFRNAISVRNDPDFNPDMQRLIQGINRFIGTAPISVQYFEPETIHIPTGTFVMGSQPGPGIPNHETPQHELSLPEYRIGKYPVINAQFEEFIRQTGRLVTPAMGWDGQRVPAGLEQHPVAGVTWFEALAYCQWLSEQTSRKYSLPNEAQWEKACRGGKNSLYPWGNEFDAKRSNQSCSTLAAVDAYPPQNDFGCFDLVGNVRQWTCSLWGEKRIAPESKFAYPWRDDRRNDLSANRQIRRVVRGSSFKDNPDALRCSNRSGQLPEDEGFPEARQSFRVVMLVS
ncbi:MAG TPA: SUMF1/EgtB/PvdO family nonheme iron enzyme [Anaerolineales bacterium]|nr:SUMF1/EgtB/PvdO family nonheme iron enzyme [Anaerolineales bacterium]